MQSVDSSVTCAHCGDTCREGAVTYDSKDFCCTGCCTVYQILKDHDLCDYYGVDPRAGVSQRTTRNDIESYSILDDAIILRRFTDWSGGDRMRLRFEVPAMHCASCIWLLDQLHKFDDGIESSEVDFLRKTVRVDIDTTLTSPSNVARLLSKLGYEPLLSTEGTEKDIDDERRRKTRDIYLRLGVAGFAAGNVMMISIARYLADEGSIDPTLDLVFNILSIGLSIPVLLFSAAPWFKSAFGALRFRKINLDVPVALGISALFSRSIVDIATATGEGFLDSFAGLVFFLLIGRLFQQKAFDAVAFDRTYRSFFPLSVRVERMSEEVITPIEQVKEGDVLSVRNGEVIPCDSILLSNAAYVDYSFVTGESLPVECLNGSMVHAGGKVVGAQARLAAAKDVSQSYLASLWERSGARTERRSFLNMSDRFGLRFTLMVMVVAIVGFLFWLPDWQTSLVVLTAVLIIACPCALTIAAPITLGTGIGRLSVYGVYVKNSETLLELDRVSKIVFDKTGTLTDPSSDVHIHADRLTEDDLLAVQSVSANSMHPVSRAIAGSRTTVPVQDVREEVGKGISGRALGRQIDIGSLDFIQSRSDAPIESNELASSYIAVDGVYAGFVSTTPRIRRGVREMVTTLRQTHEVVLLSGDTDRDRTSLGDMFAPYEMSFNNRPEKKELRVGEMRSKGRRTQRVLMIGDGLNDAGAMAAADVSIGVADGTSTLVPACDVVLPGFRIQQVPLLLRYAHTMTNVIRASLIFTVFYNGLGLTLALMGVLTPVITAIMMPVSTLIVIGISVGGARWFARRKVWG